MSEKLLGSEQMLQIALTSPALKWQSPEKGNCEYPANFRGRVPLKVRLAKDVLPDVPVAKENTVALADGEYYVWVNSYGAVSSILPNGEKLGLLPQEFDVVAWHEPKIEDSGKTPIMEWIKDADISIRLSECLKRYCKRFLNTMEPGYSHIEDLTQEKFLSVDGNGKKSWKEFCEITGYNERKSDLSKNNAKIQPQNYSREMVKSEHHPVNVFYKCYEKKAYLTVTIQQFPPMLEVGNGYSIKEYGNNSGILIANGDLYGYIEFDYGYLLFGEGLATDCFGYSLWKSTKGKSSNSVTTFCHYEALSEEKLNEKIKLLQNGE